MKRQLLIHVNFPTVQLEIYFSKKKRIASNNQLRILFFSFNFQIKVLLYYPRRRRILFFSAGSSTRLFLNNWDCKLLSKG